MTTKDQQALAKLYNESFDDYHGGHNGPTDGGQYDDEQPDLNIDSIFDQLWEIQYSIENSGIFKKENIEIYHHLKAVMDILAKHLPTSKFHDTYDLDRQ
jgi:hypothetical protein